HTQRSVALELVDPAVLGVDSTHDGIEEEVEQGYDLDRGALFGKCRGTDDVDEQHGDLAFLALETDARFEGAAGHLLADITTEELAQALAFPEAAGHVVEPGLEQPQLTVVVDGHLDLQLAVSNPSHRGAHVSDGISDRPGGDKGKGQ